MVKAITFRQICELINNDQIKEFCKKNSNITPDLIHKIFFSKCDEFKDNKHFHCVFYDGVNNNEDAYFFSSIDTFLYSILKIDNKSHSDKAVIKSVVYDTEYSNELIDALDQKPTDENIRIYELFKDFFDEHLSDNKHIIIAALAESYLISDDINPTLDHFIENVFLNEDYLSNCIEKTKDFFIKDFDISAFALSSQMIESLNESFNKANQFEAITIDTSENFELSELISEDINNLKNELVSDTPYEHLATKSGGVTNNRLNNKIRRKTSKSIKTG